MNKLIVVSGGTKGIGRAIIERFMQEGFDAATCARSATELDRLRAELAERFPQQFLFTQVADLSQRAQVDAFADMVLDLPHGVEVLVNNTGTFLPGQIHNEAEGTFETMIQTNVASAYHLTRRLLPSIMPRQSGYLINVCSTASITAYTNGGSYCVSKFALLGMTKVLREELKPLGIKVTAILPGATLTASWDGANLPAERFMQPQDVADILWASYRLSPGAVVEEILMRPQLGDIG